MRRIRSVPLALVLAVVLVTAGCSAVFGSSRPPSDGRALDAVNRSQESLAAVESYRFTLDGHVTATDGEERASFDVAGEGVVNVSRQRLNATARASDGSTFVHDDTRSAYVTGYTAYTECRVGWGRENLTRSTPWVGHTPLGRELALLNRTDVYWRGTDTVNGTEAAVVVAYPTEEELQSVADARGTGAANFEDANVQNVTETVWFDTETWRPLKVQREVRIEGGVFSSSRATATVTLRFTGYDRPTDVTRPAFDPDETWKAGCPGE